MSGHLQVAVVGGGVTGCAILYALARAGLSDCALFERTELTAGATWHSSGHIAHFSRSTLLTRLAARTRWLVDAVVAEAEQEVGLLDLGSLRLATTPAARDDFARFAETAAGIACGARMLPVEEVARMWPLADVSGTFGALHVAADCRLNAADLTQAYARAARGLGAAVRRGVDVRGLAPRAHGGWRIETSDGTWTADHVITATGIFARRTLPALGIDLPVAVVSHQYLVTEPVPGVVERRGSGAAPLPILRQPDIGLNIREEGDGFCISLYEHNATTIFGDGPPEGWGMELLPEDFESIESGFVAAMERVPCLAEAGIRSTVHGPMPWSPDFAPIVGPVPGTRGLWVAEALSYGVTWSGAIADILANWIVEGDPGEDVSALLPARFGSHASSAWADAWALATYKGVYGDSAANVAAATSPVHDVLAARGAVFEEHDGRALAMRVDAVTGTAPDQAICVLAAPCVMLARGDGVKAELRRALSDYVAPAPEREGRGWLLTKRGTVLALVRVASRPGGEIELRVEASCPRAAATELGARCPGIALAALDREAIVVIGRPAGDVARALGLPTEADPGSVCVGSEGQVTAVRLDDLDEYARWHLCHTAGAHRAVLTRIMSAIPDAAVIGVSDYEELRIAAGEARPGWELDANTTPSGDVVSALVPGEAPSLKLCRIAVAADACGTLGPDTLLHDATGGLAGRVLSATRRSGEILGIAAVEPSLAAAGGGVNVRVGGDSRGVRISSLDLSHRFRPNPPVPVAHQVEMATGERTAS